MFEPDPRMGNRSHCVATLNEVDAYLNEVDEHLDTEGVYLGELDEHG